MTEQALPVIPSPPLAPDGLELCDEQRRFMWLHQRHLVTKWHWIFGGAQLRAFTERGFTATIAADRLADLAEFGLVECFGTAGVKLTELGREAIA